MSKLIYWSVLIGYCSHLLIDCLNKTGVPFFWPNRTYFVIPGKSRWRIEVGSSSEYILCGIILLLAAGTWYLNRVGIRSWFSSVLATPQMAVNEYRTHSNTHRLKAKVQGFYTINQHPINGESFEIIDALDDTTLLVKNSSEQRTTIGNSPHSVIQARRVAVEKSEQIKIKNDSFVFKNQPITLIMPYTSSNTYISGTVEAHTKPQYIKMDMKPFKNGEFESIKVLPGLGELNAKLEIRDASPKQLKQIQNIPITGELMSRTVI